MEPKFWNWRTFHSLAYTGKSRTISKLADFLVPSRRSYIVLARIYFFEFGILTSQSIQLDDKQSVLSHVDFAQLTCKAPKGKLFPVCSADLFWSTVSSCRRKSVYPLDREWSNFRSDPAIWCEYSEGRWWFTGSQTAVARKSSNFRFALFLLPAFLISFGYD